MLPARILRVQLALIAWRDFEKGLLTPSTLPIGNAVRRDVARDDVKRDSMTHRNVGRGDATQRRASRSGISTGDVARGEAGVGQFRKFGHGRGGQT